MKYFIIISLLTFFSCQKKQKSEPVNSMDNSQTVDRNDDSLVLEKNISKTFELESNSDITMGLLTLKDFEQNGTTRIENVNDSLFIQFLESFSTYQNDANDKLYAHSEYEIYNTLAYSSDNNIAAEALMFEDSVKQIGFIIGMTEGSIFLEKDPEFLDKFSPYLSKRMNQFKNQYNLENTQPMAEDGGLIISSKEQIKRMLFWEKFAKEHGDFDLPDYANNQFEMHLYFLMFGMDKTPIHDWSDSLVVRPEIIELYKSIIKDYPTSIANEYINDYLIFLALMNFKYDRLLFYEYGKEKFPKMY